MTGKIIIYMFVLIIVAVILFVGFKAFADMRNRQNAALLLQFQSELKADVASIGAEYGSLSVEKYSLPSGFDELCFVDLKNINASDILNRSLIRNSVRSNVQMNVFLLKKNSFESFYVETFELFGYPYIFCMPADGSVDLTIAGKGRSAVIKTPPNEKYCWKAQNASLCDGLNVFFEGYKQDCCSVTGYCC